MTGRIDHAAEAAAYITKAENPDARKTLTYSGIAQAHAILAVVAELRTANLIAARAQSEFPRIDLREDNSWETVQLETDERIRERLGLS